MNQPKTCSVACSFQRAAGISTGVRAPYERALFSVTGLGAPAVGSRPVSPHGRAEGDAVVRVWAVGAAPMKSPLPVRRALNVHRLYRGSLIAIHGALNRHRWGKEKRCYFWGEGGWSGLGTLVYLNRSGRRREVGLSVGFAAAFACSAVGTNPVAGNGDSHCGGYCRRHRLGNSLAYGLPSHRRRARTRVRCLARLVLVWALQARVLSTKQTPGAIKN